MSLRNCPNTSHVVAHSSATIKIRSPCTAPVDSSNAAFSASDKNLATGESNTKSAPTFIQTKPLAPIFLARSVNASSLFLPEAAASGYVSASTQIALIDCAPAKALNSVALKTDVTSTSFISKRRSGLSTPYCSIASRHVIRSICGGACPVAAVAAAVTAAPIADKTSSWLTKDISASNCMNSYWRSARRSSSRRQRAIW